MSKPKSGGTALRAVHPNAGIEAEYRTKLDRLVKEMAASIAYWVTAAYRANEPEISLAMDAPEGTGQYAGMSPAKALQMVMRKLGKKWNKRFAEMAPEMAKWHAQAVKDRSDAQLKAILKKSGFYVEFKTTAAVNDVIQASVAQNVTLIKSIASQHLMEVEGLVMRSVQAGRDIAGLTKDLQERFDVTKRRAAFIARDQNNKSTAAITRVRQLDLGLVESEWLHSGAGRHPRPTHVKASKDKVRYKIAEGWPDPALGGKRIWPGTEPNCRCLSKPILPHLVSQ